MKRVSVRLFVKDVICKIHALSLLQILVLFPVIQQ